VQSWFKVGAKWVQSWFKVGAKWVQSWFKVGAQWVRSGCVVVENSNRDSIIHYPFSILHSPFSTINSQLSILNYQFLSSTRSLRLSNYTGFENQILVVVEKRLLRCVCRYGNK